MNRNRKMLPLENNKKGFSHFKLFFIFFLFILFFLLLTALKVVSHASELGSTEDEISVSNNDEDKADSETDFEKGTEILPSEPDEEDFSDSEVVLVPSLEEIDIEESIGSNSMSLMSVAPSAYVPVDGDVVIESVTFSGHRINNGEIQIHSTSSCKYVKLVPGHVYTIYSTSVPVLGYSNSGSHIPVTTYSEDTINPENTSYLFVSSSSNIFAVYNESSGGVEDPSGNDPISPEDPSGNDPSGNNPSGGGIELDGDLQSYLINYFGHKDYTIYDSEETFKNKSFFVSRYEYEILNSFKEIRILLLCVIGMMFVFLFVSRRRKNGSS